MINDDIDYLGPERTPGEEGIDEIVNMVDGLDEATHYKASEMDRTKNSWEGVINHDPRVSHVLAELDIILENNDHPLETHISGENYIEVSNGERTRPETLKLRISQTTPQLQSIDNHFFQNITETGKLYRVEDTPVAFERGPLFDEAIPLNTSLDYLEIKAPTQQAYFEDHYSQALEEYENLCGEVDLEEIFSSYNEE